MRQPPDKEATGALSNSSVNPTDLSSSRAFVSSATCLSTNLGREQTHLRTGFESSGSSSACDSAKTEHKSGSRPSIFPLSTLRMSVVFPTPFLPQIPYLRPHFKNSRVLCNNSFPPYASENSTSHAVFRSGSKS